METPRHTKQEVNRRGIPLSNETKVEEWRARSSLTLIIENIPSHWMVAELKKILDGFGKVVRVEIFEDREVNVSLSPSANDV